MRRRRSTRHRQADLLWVQASPVLALGRQSALARSVTFLAASICVCRAELIYLECK